MQLLVPVFDTCFWNRSHHKPISPSGQTAAPRLRLNKFLINDDSLSDFFEIGASAIKIIEGSKGDNCLMCIYIIFVRICLAQHACQIFHTSSLHWRHNDHDGVSNHQPYGCLLNRLFRRRSKKTSKLRVTGLCVGNSPGPVNSPHKGPVTRKMFPFDDVIMLSMFYKHCISPGLQFALSIRDATQHPIKYAKNCCVVFIEIMSHT